MPQWVRGIIIRGYLQIRHQRQRLLVNSISDTIPHQTLFPARVTSYSSLYPLSSKYHSVKGARAKDARVQKEKVEDAEWTPPSPVSGTSSDPPDSVLKKESLMGDSPVEDLSPTGWRNMASVEQQRPARQSKARMQVRTLSNLTCNRPPVRSGRSVSGNTASENDSADGTDADAEGSTDEEYYAMQATHQSIFESVTSSQPLKPIGPRPRYHYSVPPQLLSTQKALGELC